MESTEHTEWAHNCAKNCKHKWVRASCCVRFINPCAVIRLPRQDPRSTNEGHDIRRPVGRNKTSRSCRSAVCWTQLLEPLQYQLARRLCRGRGVYGLCFLASQNAWVTHDKTHSPSANSQEALLETQQQSAAAPLIIVKQRKWQVYSPEDNVLYFISKPLQSAKQNRDYGLLEDVKNTSEFSCHKTPHDKVTLRNVLMDAFPHDNSFFKNWFHIFYNIFCITAGLQRHCSTRWWARGHPLY